MAPAIVTVCANPPQARRVRLRLFGAPQVMIDERAVHVGSRKALALLAVLALDGASARARLAALFWPDQDDASARRNLRREVFRLRNAGVPIDDGDAQSLALAAGPAPECDVLDPASALPPGILLDGFDRVADDEFSDWLSNWRSRLAQRGRVDAAQAAAAHEQRGELRPALDLHLAQLELDPTNESAAQHALRLHGRLGERDAALALFARLESQLHHQLGLAPLPATREIVQQLRAAEVRDIAPGPSAISAALTTPSPVRRAPLPTRAPFAGRANEKQEANTAWRAGHTVFISGPPGVGKSRLAAECAGAHGAALFVNCRPDDIHLPYSSAVRALRALLDAAPDVELPSWSIPELARLLPELGRPARDGAEDRDRTEAGGDEARLRLFDAYAQAWLRLAEHNFNVVVLDDWQFADAASLQLWSFVDARGAADSASSLGSATHAVRRLVAFRSGELAPESLAHMRRQLDAGRATLLQLEGLPQADVQLLVQQLAGQPGATLFAQRLHNATDGNPLFVLETIRHLFESGLLSVDSAGGWRTPFDAVTSDYVELPVPPSARAAMLARVRALGEGAVRLLEAASLAGDAFDLPQLAGTAGLDDADSVAALEHAQAAQILRSGPDEQYRFVHDLFRQCVADSLSPARRLLVHARLARNLAATGGVAARIADHFEKAHLERDAAPWFVRAGDAAAAVFDFDTALSHYEHALQLGLEARVAYDVHDRRLTLLHRLHRTDEELRELSVMAELAKSFDDSAAPFELASRRAATLFSSGRVGDALVLARWVAEGAPTLALQVHARYKVGCALMFLGDHQAAAEQLCAALADAPTAQPAYEPMICAYLSHIAVSSGALDVAEEHYERGLRAANALDGPLARAHMQNAGYRIAEARGQRGEAIRRLEDGNAFATGTGDVNSRINYLFNLIIVHINGGDAEAARVRRAEVMALLHGKSDPKARFFEHFSAGRLAVCEGNLGLAWQSLQAAIDAAEAAGDTSMQRGARLVLALLAADCRLAIVLNEQLEKLVTLGPHRDGELVLIEEALYAQLEIGTGHVSAARVRMERACGAQRVQAHSADPAWQENTEFARVLLAAARLHDGDPAAARQALAAVHFSPRLMATAAAVALDIAVATETTDQAAIEEAESLLATGTIAPLEAARLWHALSAAYAQRGETRAARDAASAYQRLADALAASVTDATPEMVMLRNALLGQFESWRLAPA